MKKYIIISLLLISWQIQAESSFKHGIYLSQSIGNIDADISGKHQDFSAFTGTNPQDITEENANIYNGQVSNYRSFGYNLRHTPKIGFGYEVGIYLTKIKLPTQQAALIHDDGIGFKQNTPSGPVDVVVDSPSSYIKTFDIYIGGLYNFAKIAQTYTPYIGAGYAKTKGDWFNSYYSGTPGNDPRYGTEGKTNINGNYISFKVGANFMEHYNIELEHAKHKFHADSFRSFNINGSDANFNRNTLNFIYNF